MAGNKNHELDVLHALCFRKSNGLLETVAAKVRSPQVCTEAVNIQHVDSETSDTKFSSSVFQQQFCAHSWFSTVVRFVTGVSLHVPLGGKNHQNYQGYTL